MILAVWALAAGGAFALPIVLGVDWPELELVGSYVYLVVVAGGALGLALTAVSAWRQTMSNSKVAVLKTSPETVVSDYAKLMKLADFETHLPKDKDTILKINISWHHYFPACSTTPWQLDGVTQALKDAGYDNLIPAQNRTVVVDPKLGAKSNHLESVIAKHGLEFLYLYEPGVKWIKYEPKSEMLVLDKVFPDGIMIPDALMGKNAVHLPTVKTHVFTTMTGAMKNAFGGLLRENRHWTHSVIHETLVDLLAIQKEIHPGIFAVTDGTIAGDGPGPRAMMPHVKNYILASADQVAIDAIAAKMMGFDPMDLEVPETGSRARAWAARTRMRSRSWARTYRTSTSISTARWRLSRAEARS